MEAQQRKGLKVSLRSESCFCPPPVCSTDKPLSAWASVSPSVEWESITPTNLPLFPDGAKWSHGFLVEVQSAATWEAGGAPAGSDSKGVPWVLRPRDQLGASSGGPWAASQVPAAPGTKEKEGIWVSALLRGLDRVCVHLMEKQTRLLRVWGEPESDF